MIPMENDLLGSSTVPNPPTVIHERTTVTAPQDITVETMLEKLERHRRVPSDTLQYPDGGPLLIPAMFSARIEQPAPLYLTNEEFQYLFHCLEEKKMTNWIITGLEKEVSDMRTQVDREKHLHLDTLSYLKSVMPSSIETFLFEQERLRGALHDSKFSNLQMENTFLKGQIHQFTQDLMKAQTKIQSFRGQFNGSEVQKLREELYEKDQKLVECQDNLNILEFDLEGLKNELNLKKQQIDDLEGHLRVLEEDSRISGDLDSFIQKSMQKEYEKEVRLVREEYTKINESLRERIKALEKSPQVTQQPDLTLDILRANFEKIQQENAKIREKLAILELEHATCPDRDTVAKERDRLVKRIRDLEAPPTFLQAPPLGEALARARREMEKEKMEVRKTTKKLKKVEATPTLVAQAPPTLAQAPPQAPPTSEPTIEALEAQIAGLKAEVARKQKISLEFSGEVGLLLMTLHDLEKQIQILTRENENLKNQYSKSKETELMQKNMKIAQIKYELEMVKDQLVERDEEVEELKQKIAEMEEEKKKEEEDVDSDGWIVEEEEKEAELQIRRMSVE